MTFLPFILSVIVIKLALLWQLHPHGYHYIYARDHATY
ncbi:hypothetical protein yinte0001_21950 [Yersinia intermedia ATCC 29909]|nr:hypothetical protein yinte0001_21950 [Yersinia intermedia ATCC 29909]